MENYRLSTIHQNWIMEKSLYWYVWSPCILTNVYTSALTTKEFPRGVATSLFNKAYTIIRKKDDSFKKNARIRQVLRENGCISGNRYQ